MRLIKTLLSFLFLIFFSLSSYAKKEFERPSYPLLDLAIEAIDNNNSDLALDYLTRELKKNPKNGYASLLYATLIEEENQYGLCLDYLDKALKYVPRQDKGIRSLIYEKKYEIYRELNENNKALETLEQGLKELPKDIDILSSLGKYYISMENYPEAANIFKQITDIEPNNPLGYAGLGYVYLLAEDFGKAMDNLNYAIKLQPSNSVFYAYRGEVELNLGKYRDAADDLIRAYDIDGNDYAFSLFGQFPEEGKDILYSRLKTEMLSNPTDASYPYILGILASTEGKNQQAIEYLQIAAQRDPHPYIYSALADEFYSMGDLLNAIKNIDLAIDLYPYTEYREKKADWLGIIGNFDDSLKLYKELIEEDPSNAYYYISRADTYLRMENWEKAKEDLQNAISLVPECMEIPGILIRYADALNYSGDKLQAKELYSKIIEIEESNISNLENEYIAECMAYALSGLEKNEEAIEFENKLLEQFPENLIQRLYGLACIYSRAGKNDEAFEILNLLLDSGYNNIYLLNTDYDLKGLRTDPRFKEIINLMETPEIVNENIEENQIVEIPFTKESGVFKVKCEINGLPLHFIFDTGASQVTLSQVEANFMLKNDYIKPSDFIGTGKYIDANGDISEGTVLNLRNVDFGGLHLDNVRASVVRNQKAPLLLGQSVLGRLGKIEIDNNNQRLIITKN